MISAEEKAQRFLIGKKSSKEGDGQIVFLKDSFLFKDWFLSSFWEKLLFILGGIALFWTIFERVFLGRW